MPHPELWAPIAVTVAIVAVAIAAVRRKRQPTGRWRFTWFISIDHGDTEEDTHDR